MSINWVMLSPRENPPFTPLPGEQIIFTSPPRIGLSLATPAHYPGKQQTPFALSHSTGALYLTNRRIIYLPDKPTDMLKSFAAPILNLHDSHVTAPFFGPNVWIALLQPTSGGGIPVPGTGVVELKFTFKEGGAFDFHTRYERIRERLQQVVEMARLSGGQGTDNPQTAINAVNDSNVNLDELPAYQEESDGPLIAPTAAAALAASQHNSPVLPQQRDSIFGVTDSNPLPKTTDNAYSPPNEPPPGYEEAQMAGVQDELERRLSRSES